MMFPMTAMGQEWHNTNRSLGSRRSAETDDREVPEPDILVASDQMTTGSLRPVTIESE
jgi:hypothetical protein